jgi:hypothetical protein
LCLNTPFHQVEDDLDGTCLDGLLQGLPGRAVYNVLVDSAVDEKLALAIFQAMSHGKEHAKSSVSMAAVLPLETLHIRVKGGDRIVWSWANASTMRRPRHVLQSYMNHMGRSWRVERDPQDDRRDVLHATEVSREARLHRGKSLRERWLPGSQIEPIFRRIWPEKAEWSDWINGWESWPLEMFGDEDEEE